MSKENILNEFLKEFHKYKNDLLDTELYINGEYNTLGRIINPYGIQDKIKLAKVEYDWYLFRGKINKELKEFSKYKQDDVVIFKMNRQGIECDSWPTIPHPDAPCINATIFPLFNGGKIRKVYADMDNWSNFYFKGEDPVEESIDIYYEVVCPRIYNIGTCKTKSVSDAITFSFHKIKESEVIASTSLSESDREFYYDSFSYFSNGTERLIKND